MNTAIQDSYMLIKPSNKLCECIKKLKTKEKMPKRIECIAKNQTHSKENESSHHNINEFVTTSEDCEFISSIENNFKFKPKDENIFAQLLAKDIKTFSPKNQNQGYLQLDDLIWLSKQFEKERDSGTKIYLHELLKDCSLYVPENEKTVRNPDLEKRCIRLKNQQDNKRYQSMTKNVDNSRFQQPEETIAFQLKQMNKQLIAVGQFIISVLAGFAFGFIGVELLVGNLDFGFRLLLGIMCALIIALAELYFLAKQLVDY